MPLATYEELVQEIQEYLARPDLTEQIPTFIKLAEMRAQRESNLRHRWTEGYTSGLTMTSGQDYVDLPTDAIEVRWIRIDTNPPRRCQVVSPEIFDRVRWRDDGGIPQVLLMRGLQIALAPTPTDTHSYDILFYKGITSLTAAAPTNYLLTNHPDVYLYGALFEGKVFDEDNEGASKYDSLFQRALKTLNKVEARARTGGGPLAIRPDSMPGAAGRHTPIGTTGP